jgi:predicted nuclease of predicted toxin-antitoxin system
MKFLIDRCAGTFIAEWLRAQGHDVVESRELGTDPGDEKLLELATRESRILITIDTDFGQLIFVERIPHAGLVRLPDVPSQQRLAIVKELLARFSEQLEAGSIITVRGGKIRVSKSS